MNQPTHHDESHWQEVSYLPYEFRELIEKQYYEKINQSLIFENVIKDPHFLDNPLEHLGLYTDHGVIHVRNVTSLVLEIMPHVNGVLIPQRDPLRLEFMKGYGCVLAFIHDIGMIAGRVIHAEYLAHEVFTPNFDSVIELIWQHNVGGLPERILKLCAANSNMGTPNLALRELLALAYCHSKSAVPINILNDRSLLRDCMQSCLSHTLAEIQARKLLLDFKKRIQEFSFQKKDTHDLQHRIEEVQSDYDRLTDREETHHKRKVILAHYYQDFLKNSYLWLKDNSGDISDFVDDIIDTLRVIRSADALRQRGVDLKTSGNYQIFLDHRTANAVYALQSTQNEIFLLEGDKPINAVVANLASVNLTPHGDLNFSFYRGAFGTKDAIRHGAENLAILIEDIQADVVSSFSRPLKLAQQTGHYLKKNQKIYI